MKQSAKDIRQGKQARQERKETPSQEYIRMICRLYGDIYDDRKEDSKPKGLDWEPGLKACHKSISSFQKELDDIYGILFFRFRNQFNLDDGVWGRRNNNW